MPLRGSSRCSEKTTVEPREATLDHRLRAEAPHQSASSWKPVVALTGLLLWMVADGILAHGRSPEMAKDGTTVVGGLISRVDPF